MKYDGCVFENMAFNCYHKYRLVCVCVLCTVSSVSSMASHEQRYELVSSHLFASTFGPKEIYRGTDIVPNASLMTTRLLFFSSFTIAGVLVQTESV